MISSSHIRLTGSANTLFTGTLTGDGSLEQQGTGHVTIVTNSPAFTGTLAAVNDGTLTFSGSTGGSVVTAGTALSSPRLQLAAGSTVKGIQAQNGHLELQGDVTTSGSTFQLTALVTLDVVGTAPGVTALSAQWVLAEGRVGNVDGDTNAQTYILLANPGMAAADVTITFLRDDPSTNVTHTFRGGSADALQRAGGPGHERAGVDERALRRAGHIGQVDCR
jgi:hypothetical protein